MLYGGVNIVGEPDLANVRKLDLLSMPAVQDMMRIGMAIDREWFYGLSSRLSKEITNLKAQILEYVPAEQLDDFIAKSDMDSQTDYTPFNPDSSAQLADLLFKTLRIGEGKVLKRTKGGQRISTGKRQLEQLKREHPILPLVLQYREYQKLQSTYVSKLPIMARCHPRGADCPICGLAHEHETWRVHTKLLWTRTSTGRMSSKDPNLANQPIRSELGRESRKGFVAAPGMKIVACDWSQLQLRFLAHMSQDKRMAWVYQNGKDIHAMTAMWIFDLPDESHIDSLAHRQPAKGINFGIAFLETPKGLYEQLLAEYGRSKIPVPDTLTQDWCSGLFEKWHGTYESVLPYTEVQAYRARRYGLTWDMFGRIRYIPEVQSVHRKVVAEGLRYAANQPIQSPDSGTMRLALAQIQDEICQPLQADGIWCWPIMTIYDEVLLEVENDYAQYVAWEVGRIMENVLIDKQSGESWCRVPITADSKVMERWSK